MWCLIVFLIDKDKGGGKMSMFRLILTEIGIVLGTLVVGLIVCHFYTKWSDKRRGIKRKE